MKKTLSILAALMFAACTSEPNSQVKNDQDPEAKFSCSRSEGEPNHYHLTINVFETTMRVLQSSSTARFAPLAYSLEENNALSIPEESPRFWCLLTKPEADNYSLSINVFEDRLIILQSSDRARYAPLKYTIATSGAGPG